MPSGDAARASPMQLLERPLVMWRFSLLVLLGVDITLDSLGTCVETSKGLVTDQGVHANSQHSGLEPSGVIRT